jgi:hypothetical protein
MAFRIVASLLDCDNEETLIFAPVTFTNESDALAWINELGGECDIFEASVSIDAREMNLSVDDIYVTRVGE